MCAAVNGPVNPPEMVMSLKVTIFGAEIGAFGSKVTLNEAFAQDEMKEGGSCCWGLAL
jgi:hypothetical protein